MTSQDPQNASQDAPHFTREWLLSALRYVRGDFEAALSGEADDDERARSRMLTARALGLDALAPDVLSAIKSQAPREGELDEGVIENLRALGYIE